MTEPPPPIWAIIGFCCWRLSARHWASRKAISLPPRMTNWSMAYWALSEMSFGAMTSSSLMSSSILSTSMPTRLTVKSFLQFADERPRLAALLAHLHHHRVGGHAEHRQRAHDADDRLLRRFDARDGARQIVLQQPFAVRREEGDGLLLVRALDRQAEVEPFSRRATAGLRGRPTGLNPRRPSPAADRISRSSACRPPACLYSASRSSTLRA